MPPRTRSVHGVTFLTARDGRPSAKVIGQYDFLREFDMYDDRGSAAEIRQSVEDDGHGILQALVERGYATVGRLRGTRRPAHATLQNDQVAIYVGPFTGYIGVASDAEMTD